MLSVSWCCFHIYISMELKGLQARSIVWQAVGINVFIDICLWHKAELITTLCHPISQAEVLQQRRCGPVCEEDSDFLHHCTTLMFWIPSDDLSKGGTFETRMVHFLLKPFVYIEIWIGLKLPTESPCNPTPRPYWFHQGVINTSFLQMISLNCH